jgi:hypothetical protein
MGLFDVTLRHKRLFTVYLFDPTMNCACQLAEPGRNRDRYIFAAERRRFKPR